MTIVHEDRVDPEAFATARADRMDVDPTPPRLSVALCTYNGERFVDEQLDSIARQSRLPDELVIGDDASSDRTPQILKTFSARAQFPVRLLLHAEHIGTRRNFASTLEAQAGDLVLLSDQDDRWHPEKVSRLLAQFSERPDLLLLHTNARIVDDAMRPLGYDLFDALHVSGQERRWIREGDAFDAFIRRNLATGATIAFRRTLLDLALPIPDGWVHDEWLATIASAVGRVDFIDEALIDYRQHGRNQIGARRLSLRALLDKAHHVTPDWYGLQMRRTEALLARLIDLGERVPHDRLVKVNRKLAHLRTRGEMPASRAHRIVPIAIEIIAGRYARYGTGLRSIVTDLWRRA